MNKGMISLSLNFALCFFNSSLYPILSNYIVFAIDEMSVR